MTNDFDPDWPHGHVVDDCPAQIVVRDGEGDYPIRAIVQAADGDEHLFSYTSSGRYYKGEEASMLDIRNAPAPRKRIKGWVNIYYIPISNCEMASVAIHPSKEQADSASRTNRLACIYIDVEEGEGL